MLIRLTTFLLLAAVLCLGQAKTQPSSVPVPRTVDEAVNVLKTQWLSETDREWILRNPKDLVKAMLHFGFGTGVRNHFKLWQGNPELMTSCGVDHPESCSGVIIERLWESIRKDAGPDVVRRIDCQFHLAEAIVVDTKPIASTTMDNFLKRVQLQIDQQLPLLQSALSPGCEATLRLKAVGKPDLSCWAAVDRDQPVALDRLLFGMSINNSFRVQHSPPELQLVSYRPCHWQNPPPPRQKWKLKKKDVPRPNQNP